MQIEHYLRVALEAAYLIGQKPVETEIMDSIFAKDRDDLEPQLTRQGYHIKTLAELLDTKPAEIRLFLHGKLTPARTQELKNQLLNLGLSL